MDTVITAKGQQKKIHPHKLAMWVAMASISMMFAGLTSAYIVRQAQGNFRIFQMPTVFWASTVCILLSSVTLWMGVRAFRQRRMPRYRMLLTTTLILGLLFAAGQAYGFWELYQTPQVVKGLEYTVAGTAPVRVDGNPSESFLFIIAGMHLLHIVGGIIALLIVFLSAYRRRVKVYNSTGLEVISTYWHFVDALWIYLFCFFLANQ